ncbi:MAG: efflux RND transporter periplasmic adaptor subunit [Kiritimatiellia bacterium]
MISSDPFRRAARRWGPFLLAAGLCACQHLPPDSAKTPAPVPVVARTAGTVAEIRVAPGADVQPGEWVATLAPQAPLPDPVRLRQALQERESALATARTEYLEIKQRTETGRSGTAQLATARQAFETAETDRNRTLADLKTAQQAREQLRHYAPCAGTVRPASVAAGQTVAAGTSLLFIQPRP